MKIVHMSNLITNYRKTNTQTGVKKYINISNSSHVLVTTASTDANDISLIGKTLMKNFCS